MTVWSKDLFTISWILNIIFCNCSKIFFFKSKKLCTYKFIVSFNFVYNFVIYNFHNSLYVLIHINYFLTCYIYIHTHTHTFVCMYMILDYHYTYRLLSIFLSIFSLYCILTLSIFLSLSVRNGITYRISQRFRFAMRDSRLPRRRWIISVSWRDGLSNCRSITGRNSRSRNAKFLSRECIVEYLVKVIIALFGWKRS